MLRWAAAGIVVINGFFPAVWILFTSLKTETELVQKPITWWPAEPTMENYIRAFADQPLLHYLKNSFLVATGATVLSLLVAAFAAYAIARLNLKRAERVELTAGAEAFTVVTFVVDFLAVDTGFLAGFLVDAAVFLVAIDIPSLYRNMGQV